MNYNKPNRTETYGNKDRKRNTLNNVYTIATKKPLMVSKVNGTDSVC